MGNRILIVDDDRSFRVVAQAGLEAEGWEVRTASSGGDGLAAARGWRPHVVLLDRNLPDADGLEVLSRLLADRGPDAPLVVMATAYGEIENAVAAVKAGAFDYLAKPIELPALLVAAGRALEASRLRRRAEGLAGASRRRLGREPYPGTSPAMRTALALADSVAASPDTTVLVTGESGTGKQLIAQRIHLATPGRGDGPFVELNCAAIPETLLEAELFGHEKGAFTDATRTKPGLLEEAEGGTLFLDEVGDMPVATQAKLLKVLETRVFRRLGGRRDIVANVRFVAATHRDLDAGVAEGRFRLDLFHRLAVFKIHLPPLRERSEDVLPLARAFLAELSTRAGKRIDAISPAAERLLTAYAFPGNVRELRNVIERAVILETLGELSRGALLLDSATPPAAAPAPIPAEGSPPPTLAEVERAYLAQLLDRAHGNRSQVARWMGVSYPTVAKKIADHGIDVSRWRGEGTDPKEPFER